MRVDRLTLKDFTVFAEAEFEFSPGLNVLIGANGTGKSHVLKAIYSITRYVAINAPLLRALTEGEDRKDWAARASTTLGPPIMQGFEKTFRPEPGRPLRAALVRRGAQNGEFVVHGDFGIAAIELGEGLAKMGFQNSYAPGGHAVFLPANEVLSIYPGFVAADERRELSFDGTFRDLCVDLSASPLRSVSPPVLAEIVAELDNAVGGKTVLQGDRFYVQLSEDWLLEAAMLAEGLRKLAAMTQLIRNGSLAENCVLLWDEPETNLNPKLIPVISQALMKLAGAGIQVFIATHDYLLTSELSLAAEYQTEVGKAAKTRFFCLSRDESIGPVHVTSGETLAEIPEDPILQEFAAHYDRERDLFYGQGSIQTAEPKT